TEVLLKGKSEAEVEQFRKLPSLERLGQPEDIADVVSFLAGPTGGWVNSQVIRANGGFAGALRGGTTIDEGPKDKRRTTDEGGQERHRDHRGIEWQRGTARPLAGARRTYGLRQQ